MKAPLQAKLLHVLQDAQFTKLGSNKPINVDVRVVAATNRDLEAMMLRGEFREDLYYRLKVIEVTVPPLRERRDEIPHLTDFFIDRYARRYNRPTRELSPDARASCSSPTMARQHPRAREHDQADRDPAGRAARRSRDDARAARRCRGVRRGDRRPDRTRASPTPRRHRRVAEADDDESEDEEPAAAGAGRSVAPRRRRRRPRR